METTKKKLKINGHSHLLPYPEDIPSFMREKEIFWVDDERKYMLQKNWKRPVTDSSFFLNEKLEWMDKFNIEKALLLPINDKKKSIGLFINFLYIPPLVLGCKGG